MNSNVEEESYTPVRSSDRTERARLCAVIKDLKLKLAGVAVHSSIVQDPNFARREVQYQKEIDAAVEKLTRFDEKQIELHTYATSDETTAAQEQVMKAATAFDQKLNAVARSAKDLVEAGAKLTSALRITDQGVPLSRSALNNAIRSRIIFELGSKSPIKFDGFGSFAKPSVSLREFFKTALESK